MRAWVRSVFVGILAAAPAVAQNSLTNPGFDTDIGGWKTDGQPGVPHVGASAVWSAVDANGSPTSGSVAISTHSSGAGVWQTARVVPGGSYDLSVQINMDLPGTFGWLEVRWTAGLPSPSSGGCQGGSLGSASTPTTVSADVWETLTTTAIAPAGAGCGQVRVAGSNGGALNPHHLSADDVVFRRTGTTGAFHTVTPCRLVDTRMAPGLNGGPELSSPEARNFLIGGNCDIPVEATAVAGNLTVVDPTGGGHLKAYPAAEAPSAASALNFGAMRTRANNLVLTLGPDGWATIKCEIPGGGSTHVLLDVTGYYQ